MKERKKKKVNVLKFILTLCLIIGMIAGGKPEYIAASSYTNAKEFYNSVYKAKKGEANGGNFYIGTQAKLATSSSNLKFETIGYDVKVSGNNASVQFSVALGAGIHHLPYATAYSTIGGLTYEYNLFCIPITNIINYAMAVNSTEATRVFQSSTIKIEASAIITTKQYSSKHGGITENGGGGLYESGIVFHLGNPNHLYTATHTPYFSGYDFSSYIGIDGTIYNHQLSILYDTGTGTTLKDGYSSKLYQIQGITVPNALYKGNFVKMDTYSMMQTFCLENPTTIGLNKTGYHLEPGREWRNSKGYTFSASQAYAPSSIDTRLTTQSAGAILYANWVANEYTVKYDINTTENGQGYIESSEFIYDKIGSLMPATYTKRGYRLVEGKEWNTKPDGTGISYASGQEVLNMTAKHNDVITLYAQWEPCIYKITEDKAGGTGGTDIFYQKYDTGFYAEEECVKGTEIDRIILPTRTGYNFLGYYNNMMGIGGTDALVIGSDARITFNPNTYAEDTTIFAIFEPKEIPITFDKQGGIQGDDTATAVYDRVFPAANAPYRPGYSFKGYFTKPDGQGEQYYNEFMSTDVICKLEVERITLYAHWVDETAPIIDLVATTDSWTDGKDANGAADPLKLTVYAKDYGVGLARIELYQEGVADPVAVQETPNEKSDESVVYTNLKEGVVTYKAVVYDKNGNRAEGYKSVKYDTQAPFRIKVNEQNVPLNATLNEKYFGISIDISDKNVQ